MDIVEELRKEAELCDLQYSHCAYLKELLLRAAEEIEKGRKE